MENESIELIQQPYIFFIGESRSITAQERGWSWEMCQLERRPRLCAIQLFEALEACEIDPYDTEHVTFHNLWDDNGEINPSTLELFSLLNGNNYTIVAMGNRVQKVLDDMGIKHIKIVHPAARGVIRRKEIYSRHIAHTLGVTIKGNSFLEI